MLCITIHGMVRSRRPSTRVHTRNIVLLVPGTILQSNSNAYVVPFIMPVYAYIYISRKHQNLFKTEIQYSHYGIKREGILVE